MYSLSVWPRYSQPYGGLPAEGSVEDVGVDYLPETAAMPGGWDREKVSR